MSAPSIIIGSGVTLSSVTIDGSTRNAINTRDLQLYLDASNGSSYSGSGTTWYDLSDNHNDVVMTDPSQVTFFSIGGINYFNLLGSGYFTNSNPVNMPVGSSPYHFSAWVKWDSTWPAAGGIVSIGTEFGTPNQVNAFRTMNSPYGLDNYWWGNDYAQYVPLTDYTQWVFVSAQWNGYTRSLWVNGHLLGNNTTSGLNVTSNFLQIGETWPSNGENLLGKINQVMIYNRALAPLEILNNYNATKSKVGL